MNPILAYFLDLVRIAFVGGAVYLVAHYLLKQWNSAAYQRKMIGLRKQQNASTTAMRLQAFERMTLLCERIALPSLLIRLQTADTTVKELQPALMLAVQQEFEYNISQQVYVSDSLWSIIKLTRDNTLAVISHVASGLDASAPSIDLAMALLSYLDQQKLALTDTAMQAIRTEAGSLL